MFWLVVLLLAGGGGFTLHVLGPVRTAAAGRHCGADPFPAGGSAGAATADPTTGSRAPKRARPAPRPGRDTPGPITDPDPALLEPMTGQPANLLPRIAMDGRMPMQLYAAGFDPSTRRPRVGLLVAGVGLNEADSAAAIRALPGRITLAFSPDAARPEKLLAAARLAEHEYLLSLTMEPQGFPLKDPGPQAMMASLAPEQNRQRLEWALSRLAGYVGATGTLGTTRGERFAALPDQMNPVLTELAQRGLLYVDSRPGASPLPIAWRATVDIVIDDPATAAGDRRQAGAADTPGAREAQCIGSRHRGAAGHRGSHRVLGEQAGGRRPGTRSGQRAGAAARRRNAMSEGDRLPYRRNVGAALFNR